MFKKDLKFFFFFVILFFMAGDELLTPIRSTPPPPLRGRCFLCRWYRDPDKMEINRNDHTPTLNKNPKTFDINRSTFILE